MSIFFSDRWAYTWGEGSGWSAYKRHKSLIHELPFSPLETKLRMRSPNLHQFNTDPHSSLSPIGTNPGLKVPSVASKRVHVRKKHVLIEREHDIFWHHTFEVWSRRLLSTCFVFAQQNIPCKNFYTLRIICRGKSTVSERKLCLTVERNEMWAKCADQFGATVCLTAVKCLKAKHVRSATLLKNTCFLVSCPPLNATDGKRFQKYPHSCGRGLKIVFGQLHIYNFLRGAKHYYLKGNSSL